MPDQLGSNFPDWLQTEEDIARWMVDAGARAMWDDTKPQPAGSQVYYEDRYGNRLYAQVEHSQRFGDVTKGDPVDFMGTFLVPVRWAPYRPAS